MHKPAAMRAPSRADQASAPHAHASHARGSDRVGAEGSAERLAVLRALAANPDGLGAPVVAHLAGLELEIARYVLAKLRKASRVQREAGLWFIPSARTRARTAAPAR